MRSKGSRVLCAALAAVLLFGLCFSGSAEEYRTLQQGMSGKDVKALKLAMYWLGYFTSQDVSESYNDVMVKRVKMLQENNGLEPDGVATPELQALVFSGNAVPNDKAPSPSPVPTPSPTPAPTPVPPPMTEKGFLDTADKDEEYVYTDEEAGIWLYKTSSLSIDLRRYTDEIEPLIWFEADIQASPETPLTTYLSGDKTPGKRWAYPQKLAQDNHVVFAITDDHFGGRWIDGEKTGVIIRGGQIIHEATGKVSGIANLEVLAVFQDGRMETFGMKDHTAQEYLDMGVTDTYAFGPVLIKNGQLSEYMLMDEYYTYHEPRCAIGMIEPYHYYVLVAEGRLEGVSEGVYLTWLADNMMARGVQEAMNLDGGGTVALMFMGNILYKGNPGKAIRQTTSITGFGTSDQVIQE